MAKGNVTAADALSMFLNNVSPTYGGNLYLQLHSSNPGAAGDQTTNEINYTGYARVAIVRDNSGTGWTTTGTSRNNAGLLQFPTCTDNLGGTPTATHLSVGTAASGAGQIQYFGPLTTSIAISQTITPQFAASAITISEA